MSLYESIKEWNLLVVDDDKEVIKVTHFALSDYKFLNKGLIIKDALSEDEAKKLLREEEFAIVLLDIVLEELDSGLKLIDYIRKDLNNLTTRIIIRTGQPAVAPIEEIMLEYSIHGYLNKGELTAKKLFSAITSALRSYVEIKELLQHKKGLEDSLIERTRELEELNKTLKLKVEEAVIKYVEIQKESHQKDALLLEQSKMAVLGEMVSAFGHEINTPLGISVTAASALGDSTKEIKALFESNRIKKSDLAIYLEKSEELSKIILSNVSRAAELVAGLKHIAVDQSSEQPRIVNLKHYIDEIILSLKPKFKKTNYKVRINCDDKIEIYLLAGPFSQILINLIMNSLIHGFENRDKGEITIDIKLENGILELIYSDDGNGMDEETKGKIFEQYYTTKKDRGGSGIGMYLIKKIITEKLKGTIEFFSELGKGSTFIIKFPVES